MDLDISFNPLGATLPPFTLPPPPLAQPSANPAASTRTAAESGRGPPSAQQDAPHLPSMQQLRIANCSLHGTLPADWAAHMPFLIKLGLER